MHNSVADLQEDTVMEVLLTEKRTMRKATLREVDYMLHESM